MPFQVRQRVQALLPWFFVVVLAASRWPGLLPPNFSAAYALCLCAGAFLRGRMAWGLPLGTLLATDVLLNCWYQFGRGFDVWNAATLLYLVGNYAGYALLFGLGRAIRPVARWPALRRIAPFAASGVAGTLLFYVVTNTLSWLVNPFHNPEYVKTLAGWWTALTTGTAGWPQTWEFLRNGLLGGGLFSALFAASWQDAPAESPAEKGEESTESEPVSEPQEARG